MGLDVSSLIPAAIGAGAQIGGAIINRGAQNDANQINRQIAFENRQWQERMSNTAFQRAVKDAEAAGLNTGILYGGTTAAASTPPGSTTRVEPVTAVGEGISRATSTALDIMERKAQIAAINAQTYKSTQEGRSAKAEADYINNTDVSSNRILMSNYITERAGWERQTAEWQSGMSKIEAERFREKLDLTIKQLQKDNDLTERQAREVLAQAILTELQEPGARNMAEFHRSIVGKASPYISTATGVIGSLPSFNAVRSLVNMLRKSKATQLPTPGPQPLLNSYDPFNIRSIP